MVTEAPRKAAAAAWFAPLPPLWVESSAFVTVSPGFGRRSTLRTKSWFMEPRTKTSVTFSASTHVGLGGRYSSCSTTSRRRRPLTRLPRRASPHTLRGSLLFSSAQALRESLGGPVAEGPHGQRRVDAGAGGKDRPAEDVEPRCVVNTQIGANHRRGGVLAHAAPSKIVAAAHAAKARTAPGLGRAHRAQDLFGFALHPLGQAPLVLPQIAGDTDEGNAQPAAVAVAWIQ